MVVVVFRNKLYTVRSAASGWKFVDEDVRRAGAGDEKKGEKEEGVGTKKNERVFKFGRMSMGARTYTP